MLSIPYLFFNQILRRIQQLHNNMGKPPLPSLFILAGDPYQAMHSLLHAYADKVSFS